MLHRMTDGDGSGSWDSTARGLVLAAGQALPSAVSDAVKVAIEGGPEWEKKAGAALVVGVGTSLLPRTGAAIGAQASNWRRKVAERDLESVRDPMRVNFVKLLATGVDPDDLAADAAAMFEVWERAWRAASDRRVRRMVINGLGHSFEPDIYEEGLAVRMFELLEQLSYPDLVILRRAAASDHGLQIHTETASLNQEAAIRLRDLRLLFDPGMAFYEMRPTEMGARLLHFIEDRPLPTGPDDDDDPGTADSSGSDGA